MKSSIIDLLPEWFFCSTGELSSVASGIILSGWALLFLAAGLSLGASLWRRARKSIALLEKENLKGFNRLEIYRATVEKQSESEVLRD